MAKGLKPRTWPRPPDRVLVPIAAIVTMALLAVGAVEAWRFVAVREDLLPGRAPSVQLEPGAWRIDDTSITFAVVGDSGSGGRNATRVGAQMAEAYQREPYGYVMHTGDIVYYGDLADRYDEVITRPYGPLLDAGVRILPSLGNHEFDEIGTRRILERLGLPGRYYNARLGPAEFFVLDSTPPEFGGGGGAAQLAWLEERLRASTAPWKIAVLHHPLYSSGSHGSSALSRELLEPLFTEHGVALVLAGHDHNYERTTPQHGIVHVVSGGGAKLNPVGRSEFTAVSRSVLHFLLVRIDGDTLTAQAIDDRGRIVDEFTVPRP